MNLRYTIVKHIGCISEQNNGWIKELNYISWGSREPVYDIRTWTMDHTKYGKGVTITRLEMRELYELLTKLYDKK